MSKESNKSQSFKMGDWAQGLPSQGRYSFTRDEVMRLRNVNRKAFNQVAARLARRNRIARVHGKFYVVVPLEYAGVGILPPDWFISDLMKYLGCPFYVGLLSAAEYHGAAHQRPQKYHVVTARPLRDIRCRGVGIRFFVKRNLDATPLQQMKVFTGYIPVSTPEATAIDLLRYSRRIGGLNHVLTVLQELGEVIDARKIAAAAQTDGNVAYAQRLGWLLEKTEHIEKAKNLFLWVTKQKPLPAKLEPGLPLRGALRDKRWNLWVNTEVDGDLS